MKALWTFESKQKMDKFLAILQDHGIMYEIGPAGSQVAAANELTVSVEETDLAESKRLLMKHRKRRKTT